MAGNTSISHFLSSGKQYLSVVDRRILLVCVLSVAEYSYLICILSATVGLLGNLFAFKQFGKFKPQFVFICLHHRMVYNADIPRNL